MRAQKQRRSAEGRRRAGLLLQQLRWLAGFPDEGGWRTARGEVLALEGALLSRSRRAARTAMREHPDELAALVGDVARWWRITDAILSWCSAPLGELDLLDHGGPRTARAARDLVRHQPALRPLVLAASVAWAFEPGELARALSWLAAHPDVAAHGLGSAMALLHLSLLEPSGAPGAEALHQLLRLDAPHPTQAPEAIEHLSGLLREQARQRKQRAVPRGEPRPVPRGETEAGRAASLLAKLSGAPTVARSQPKVVAWLAALLRLEPAAQRAALRLLAVAELPAVARTWVEWEQAHAPRLARAAEFAERGGGVIEKWKHGERIRDGLAAIIKAAPARCWIPDVLTSISELAGEPRGQRFIPTILRLLEAQPLVHPPLGAAWRGLVLRHLASMVSSTDHARLLWFWEDLAQALERGAPLQILAPWQQALGAHHWCWFDEDMVEAPCKRADARAIVQALVALAAGGELTAFEASSLRGWLQAGLPEALAVEAVERMRGLTFSRTPSVELLRSLVALIGPRPAELVAALARASELLSDTSYREALHLAELFARAAAAGLSWLILAALSSGQGEALRSLASARANLPRAWWPALAAPSLSATREGAAAPEPPAWMARYPAVLAPALWRLAAVDAEAEATARRRTSSDLPAAADLLREAAALRARAPLPPRMAARLANLEARLAAPPAPSPRRLARLAAKLEQAAVTIGLSRLTALTQAEATARLLRTFGLSSWPESWPTDRKTLYAVQSLQRLEAPERQLAGLLLRARTGPPPWDLRDEPANRRFLESMRRRGLELAPWLDDAPTTIQAEGPLELALCSDPLQIFQMGAHFETCLSPGGVNFFSVVANAVDINKRVLYARRAGRVVGRCLLALSDDASLLTFHPYCHESIPFRDLVADFARALARRMGAEPASSGTISKLLSHDWYDDGAHDLVGRFSALRDEAQLDLSTIEPSALPARLVELLGRRLDDLTLPAVLALPGLRRRPELVLSLSPALLALSVPTTRITAACHALRAGARDLAELLLADHGATIHPTDHARDASELLAQLRPSLLLARLRATRERGRRGWRSEPPFRLLMAGIAHEALNRPRQATALYRLALEADSYYLRDDLTARLRRLDKHRRA